MNKPRKEKRITNAGESVLCDSPLLITTPILLVGMWIGAATMENNIEVPLKTKNRTTT